MSPGTQKVGQVVRQCSGNWIQFPSDRSLQLNTLATRTIALLSGDSSRTVVAATLCVIGRSSTKPGAREVECDIVFAAFGNTLSYGGGTADLSQRRSQRRPARHHHGERSIPDQADPLIPHCNKSNKRHPYYLDGVSTERAKSIHVKCPGIHAYADGDFACLLPAEISVVAGALQIFRPHQPPVIRPHG